MSYDDIQIHRSDTPSIDVVIDQFTTTAARRPNFLIRTGTCTSEHCTVQTRNKSITSKAMQYRQYSHAHMLIT